MISAQLPQQKQHSFLGTMFYCIDSRPEWQFWFEARILDFYEPIEASKEAHELFHEVS